MPELNGHNDTADTIDEPNDDAEELAEAYAALDEDRRQQREVHAANTAPPTEPASTLEAGASADDVARPGTEEDPIVPVSEESRIEVPTNDATAELVTQSNGRVFLIDGKEYPDPDPNLPITGPRSVQAMYRDYFPGQLDNADAVEKTRSDGTLEVTFKRRIGTKGARRRTTRQLKDTSSGEIVITTGRVASVLAALSDDRPLAWDLIEQATGPDGTFRLDYVPSATQLNLAEAQCTARVRLIELAVGELHRLRPGL